MICVAGSREKRWTGESWPSLVMMQLLFLGLPLCLCVALPVSAPASATVCVSPIRSGAFSSSWSLSKTAKEKKNGKNRQTIVSSRPAIVRFDLQ